MHDIQTMLALGQLPLTVAAEYDGEWNGNSLEAIANAANHVRLGNSARILVKSCFPDEKGDKRRDALFNELMLNLSRIFGEKLYIFPHSEISGVVIVDITHPKKNKK